MSRNKVLFTISVTEQRAEIKLTKEEGTTIFIDSDQMLYWMHHAIVRYMATCSRDQALEFKVYNSYTDTVSMHSLRIHMTDAYTSIALFANDNFITPICGFMIPPKCMFNTGKSIIATYHKMNIQAEINNRFLER